MTPGQVQQFRVETKALDRLLLEDHPAALSTEGLEPALRVHKWQPENDAHDSVENNAREFPERRFVHFDQVAVHGARANRHIVILQSRKKFTRLFDRGR